MKEQLKKMASFEYHQTSFSYIDNDTREERFVGQRGTTGPWSRLRTNGASPRSPVTSWSGSILCSSPIAGRLRDANRSRVEFRGSLSDRRRDGSWGWPNCCRPAHGGAVGHDGVTVALVAVDYRRRHQ